MIEQPIAVIPPVYELPVNLGRWCRLEEVCEAAERVAGLVGLQFPVTIPELARRFGLLAKRSPEAVGRRGKRLFRFSPDGMTIRGAEVPDNLPFAEFSPPIDADTFVTEQWARDTLRFIRAGCNHVREWEERSGEMSVLGLREIGTHFQVIRLPQ